MKQDLDQRHWSATVLVPFSGGILGLDRSFSRSEGTPSNVVSLDREGSSVSYFGSVYLDLLLLLKEGFLG